MPASVPLRRDFDARHLRKLASRCKDARQSRRRHCHVNAVASARPVL